VRSGEDWRDPRTYRIVEVRRLWGPDLLASGPLRGPRIGVGVHVRFLWFVLVLIIAFLLARFVGAAVGGVVGLILAILVFFLVFRAADNA
jgi:hypothetical protein